MKIFFLNLPTPIIISPKKGRAETVPAFFYERWIRSEIIASKARYCHSGPDPWFDRLTTLSKVEGESILITRS